MLQDNSWINLNSIIKEPIATISPLLSFSIINNLWFLGNSLNLFINSVLFIVPTVVNWDNKFKYPLS